MMTQEEYMDLLAMRRQGKSIVEIAEELYYHPATVAEWLRKGGPPPKRTITPAASVIDEATAARIGELLSAAPTLLSTSIYEILRAEGFAGSYPSVVRHVRDRRGPRFRVAPTLSVPIETPPGEECQFDWSECGDWTVRWGLGEVQCFGCILCWSRYRRWWFTTSIDREHTFEGLVSFFEEVGGVPRIGRTDRMGALGVSQGRRFRLHQPAKDFARHHGLELAVCQARDAKRKGKTERPFRDLKETFLTECDATGVPRDIAELNRRAAEFLRRRVHSRPHSTTRVPPSERLEAERPFLASLPRRRFDTAYVGDRRVHPRLALVEWDGVAYSVAPEALGYKVTCQVEVDSEVLEVHLGKKMVARHTLSPGSSEPVWDPAHRRACEEIALKRSRPPLRVVADPAPPAAPARLDLGEGDYEVEPPDLKVRYGGCECTGQLP
jgi:transposase